ncbi:M15 family metallopeptidase [Lysobacter fragariae]
MDDRELQRRLQGFDFYRGPLSGTVDRATLDAIAGFLNNGRVPVPPGWSKARRVLAAKQLVCRHDQIEVGAIDGLDGPQTRHAFAVYADRLDGGGQARIPERDIEPATAEPATAPTTWPRQRDIEAFYGPKGVNQVRLQLPFPMRLAWDTSYVVNGFSIHRKAHASALRCFGAIERNYSATRRRELGLDLFGGCLNVRRMRGGESWSMHSWGIAIDFDPDRNGLHSTRDTARLARPDCDAFWKIWEDEGWVSLGRTRNYDWMHIQAARL